MKSKSFVYALMVAKRSGFINILWLEQMLKLTNIIFYNLIILLSYFRAKAEAERRR